MIWSKVVRDNESNVLLVLAELDGLDLEAKHIKSASGNGNWF